MGLMAKMGVDGNAITGITQDVNEDNSITLTIHFSNTEDVVVTIPGGSEGKAGDSVEAITMIQKWRLLRIYLFG